MISTSDSMDAKFSMERERGGTVDEPPFLMLALGDWSGDGAKKDLGGRPAIEIDRDNFDRVMAKLGARLELDLGGDGGPLALEFKELDDFHPDRIFQQLSLFSELRDVRKQLKTEDGFYEAARQVRSWFPAAEPDVADRPASASTDEAPAAIGGDLLSQILSQPSGGASAARSKPTHSSELNSLLGELVRPYLIRVDENEQAQLISAVDQATGDLMRKIIHDHKFQALESAWRGLYFFVRRTETTSDLRIYLMDATKAELTDNLKSVNSLAESILYKLLVAEAIETPGGDPWSAVIGNYAFAPEVDDVATLVRIAKICEAAGAPFISHMRPDVLGVHSLENNTEPRGWSMTADSDTGKLWRTLRTISESGYLGMTIPRFLARIPYGADTEPLETFSFEEFSGEPEHNNYLWANSAFACALLLAQSYSASGWDMGRQLRQDLDGLPVHIYESAGEQIYKPCAEVQLTHDACDQLMEYGLMPLVSYKNTDRVKLARFQSVSDPVTGLSGRWKAD